MSFSAASTVTNQDIISFSAEIISFNAAVISFNAGRVKWAIKDGVHKYGHRPGFYKFQ